jgi:tyrosyl-tRNA synthetase
MLMGLKEGQEKMSKSDPDSAIFMEDTVEDVKRKIKRAFCPPAVVANNPCLDWIKHIVFGKLPSWTLKRSAENGGDITYATYADFEADYAADKLHPGDVKANLTDAINGFLEPVRAHFASGEPKRLLELVAKYKVTR